MIFEDLTKSFGDGNALEDGNERDDDDGRTKLGEHSTKGNHLILSRKAKWHWVGR